MDDVVGLDDDVGLDDITCCVDDGFDGVLRFDDVEFDDVVGFDDVVVRCIEDGLDGVLRLESVVVVGFVVEDVDVDFDEVMLMMLSEGKVLVSSLFVRSIVVLTFVLLMFENEEFISIKMETQAAAVSDSKPFLKTFCFEGMSFLISKIAFILISLSRILKKLSEC